jgi:CubicO group peptidase (beta-lactamase class C family)
MLVDEGKLKWDDPVTNYLPGFQMFESWVTRQITVRDLLTHDSGLARTQFTYTSYDRDEVLYRVRFIEPIWSFRSRFGYSNVMYTAAGKVVAEIAGESWDDFVKVRIFRPLEMNASSTSITALQTVANRASPHAMIGNKVQVIPYMNIDALGPAGSINSNVIDMAQWVRLQLGEGTYNNEQLISSTSMNEMHMPQVVIRPLDKLTWNLLYPDAHFVTYGLGWFVYDYNGRKVVKHEGNVAGMTAIVAMMPEENLGMVILTNMQETLVTYAIMYRVFDTYLDEPEQDWNSKLLNTVQTLEEELAAYEEKINEARVKGTKPTLPLENYTGTYNSIVYGNATVTVEDGKLVLLWWPPLFNGDLERWNYDTFRLIWRNPTLRQQLTLVSFTLNVEGKVNEMKIPHVVDFKRVSETVNISASIPTLTPVPAAPGPTPTLASTPMPKQPGFERVFAIAAILAVVYFVLRRREE